MDYATQSEPHDVEPQHWHSKYSDVASLYFYNNGCHRRLRIASGACRCDIAVAAQARGECPRELKFSDNRVAWHATQ